MNDKLILDFQELEITMKRIALEMLNSDAEAKKHAAELYGASEIIKQWIEELGRMNEL